MTPAGQSRSAFLRLRSYLVLLVLGALFPMVAFSTSLIIEFAGHQRQAVESGLQDTARALSVAVDKELEGALTGLEALAASESLATGDFRRLQEQVRETLKGRAVWFTILVLDLAGKVLIDAREAMDAEGRIGGRPSQWEERMLLLEVLRTGRPAITYPALQERTGRPLVSLAIPVRHGQRVQYVVAGVFDASILTQILVLQQRLIRHGFGAVVDRFGSVIAHSDVFDQLAGATGPTAIAALGERWQEVAGGKVRGIELNGARFVVASARSLLSDWSVVVAMPATMIDETVRQSVWMVIGGGTLFMLLGALLAAFVGRRIALPIARLSSSASALGRDDPLPPIPRSRVRELDDLTAALEEAGALLQQRRVERQEAERRRDEVEADLRRSNEAKDEFLAVLSHELRNPLGAITNAVAVLKQSVPGNERTAQLGDIISRQTVQLSRLVDDLLDVSRLTLGRVILHREPVDLGEVAEQSVTTLRSRGGTARHEVELRRKPVLVDGDPVRLGQVVSNLLDNAVKYSPSGSPIGVSVEQEGGEAVLRVKDRGIGISREMLGHVFEMFFQGRGSSRASGGLGLGLAISKRLVELHRGTIVAHSAGVGQGSEFVVRLPLAPIPTRRESPALREGPHPARRVLVVEDHDDARTGLRMLLESWGHHVDEAANGLEGLRKLETTQPGVALVDVGLPGMDGYELARAVRAMPARAGTYLVALTGYGRPEDRRHAVEAGFDAHLVKPVNPEELRQLLESPRLTR